MCPAAKVTATIAADLRVGPFPLLDNFGAAKTYQQSGLDPDRRPTTHAASIVHFFEPVARVREKNQFWGQNESNSLLRFTMTSRKHTPDTTGHEELPSSLWADHRLDLRAEIGQLNEQKKQT